MIALLCAWSLAQEVVWEDTLTTGINDVVVSEDLSSVAFIGTDMSYVLSTLSWDVSEVSACGTFSMAGGVFIDSLLHIGCDDGSISTYDGSNVVQNVYVLDASSVMGLWTNNDYLYALAKSDSGGNPRVHAVDLSSGQELSGNFPSTLGYSGYQDAERVGNFLIIAQGSASVSKVDLSSGGATRDNQGPTAVSLSDVLFAPTGTNALIAAGNGGIIRFLTASNDTQYALNLNDWTDITALAIFNEYLWLADGQTLRAHDVAGNGATIGTEERLALSLSSAVVEMAALEDHLLYASSDGAYGIISSLPWIDIISLVNNGDGTYTITCTSTQEGEYQLLLGNAGTGTEISSGRIQAAVETEIVFDEPSDLQEGENRLWLDVDGGHDSVVLEIDTPPDQVVLSDDSLKSGNNKLSLSFLGLDVADIESYQVYLSTEDFSLSEYETGGPDFTVLSQEDLLVSATETIAVDLYPLENQVEYFVAVRAIDQAGTQGPISNVVSAIPKPSYGVSELSGEAGGFAGCASTGEKMMGWMMLVTLGVLARRKAMVVLMTILFVYALPQRAMAADQFGEQASWTSKAYSIDYSMTQFDSQAIQAVFGSEEMYPGLNLGASFQVLRVLDISSGLGLWRKSGLMVQEDGSSSSDTQTLTMIPLQLSAGLRLDFFRNQIIVPFANGGIDYWLWQEDWTQGETQEKLSGGKMGWHYRAGVEILLDVFDSSSASMLDVRYKIKDTYLVLSYQNQEVGDDGLMFNGESYMIGLRMQY
ncbi:MAG: hypothetical protein CL916_12480 [Deltaproteobacteria bacterium]|nr:hypothetical protein [Deltaproteobacteria bacterium]